MTAREPLAVGDRVRHISGSKFRSFTGGETSTAVICGRKLKTTCFTHRVEFSLYNGDGHPIRRRFPDFELVLVKKGKSK